MVKKVELIPETPDQQIQKLIKKYETENASPTQELSDKGLNGFFLKKGLRLSKEERKAFVTFAKDNVIFPQIHCLTRSNCKDLGISPSETAKQAAKLMLNVFERLPPLENTFTIYMGLPSDGNSQTLARSKSEKDMRFLSTSLSKSTAERFLFGTPEIGGAYPFTQDTLPKHGILKEFVLPKGSIAFPLLYVAYAHLLDAADKAASKSDVADEELEQENVNRTNISEEREVLLHPCTTFKYLGSNSDYEINKNLKLVGSSDIIKSSITVHSFRYNIDVKSDKKLTNCLPSSLR